MGFQSVTILIILVFVNYRGRLDADSLRQATIFRDICIWGTLAITVASGLMYVRKAVTLFRKHRPNMNSATMKRWIVTLGGVGYLPASGTFASLLTCLLLWLALAWGGKIEQTIVAIAGLVLFSALNIALAPWAIREFGDKTGKFVLDEAAGICLSILFLPARTGWETGINLAAAFLAFRIFDITKPPPARQLESLPEGWGILLDDLAAAVYANLVCQVVLRWIF